MSPLTDSDDQLLEAITAGLREKGQFIQHCDADDLEGINKVRSLGRRVGRNLGWKVRTSAVDLGAQNDGTVVVLVVRVESTPLHQQLLDIRREKVIRGWMESGGPGI
jgi:hypothetical protein